MLLVKLKFVIHKTSMDKNPINPYQTNKMKFSLGWEGSSFNPYQTNKMKFSLGWEVSSFNPYQTKQINKLGWKGLHSTLTRQNK